MTSKYLAYLNHNLQMYRRLVGVQLRSQLAYRGQFALDTLSTFVVTGLEFASLALVFSRFEQIQGWTLAEVAFLYGLVEMAFGLMDLIFAGFDPHVFGGRVRLGSFDQMLLRPVNLTVQVFGSDLTLRRLGKISVGLGIFSYALTNVTIMWSAPKILYVGLTGVSLILFFGALFIVGATITFWTVNSVEALNIFTYGGSYMMSYPMHIYQTWLRRFFTFVVPAAFLNYYPALYVLDKPDPFNLPRMMQFVSPVVGVVMFLLALAFWRYGISKYQSTGT